MGCKDVGTSKDQDYSEIKAWYMDAVKACLILRGMNRFEAEKYIKRYQLKERLDVFPEIQLHYDVEVIAEEIVDMNQD